MKSLQGYRRLRLSTIAAVALTISLALLLTAWQIIANYKNTLKESERGLLGYAEALNEHAARAFGEVERTVDSIAGRIAHRGAAGMPAEKELHRILKAEVARTPQASAALVIDASGRIKSFSEEFPARRIDVSDRDFYIAARDGAGADRFISRPVKTRINHKWRFVISKRILDAQGRFAGLIAVSFKPEYFDKFYRSMNIGASTRINIMRTDGFTLIVSPLNDGSYEQDFSDRDLFRNYPPAAPTGFYRSQAFGYDRSDRLAAYARTPGQPYFAVVSVRTDEALAAWRSQSLRQASLVGALVMVLFGAGMLLTRQISKLAEAEQARRMSEQRFRNLFENVKVIAMVIDPESGAILDANARAVQFYGCTRDQLLSMRISDINVQPADDMRRDLQAARTEERSSFQFKQRLADGSVRDVEVFTGPIGLNGSTVLYSISHDISDRKRAEAELRLQGEIARNIAEGIYLVNARDLTIVYANAKMEEIFGYGPGELRGRHVSVLNAPTGGDPVRTATEIDSALREAGAWRGEVLNVRKDGTAFWGHTTISKLDHPEYGEVYVSLQRDVTGRKRAEDALRENEKRLNDILSGVGSAIFIKDTHYRYTYVNRAVCDLFRLPKEEILGKSDDAFFSGSSVEEIQKSDRRVIEQGETVAREEVDLTPSDGLPRTYWAVKMPLRDSRGNIYGLCGISTDITDHKHAEEALRESEARFRGFMESGPSACLLLDPDLNYLYFNKNARELTGITLEQAIGRNIRELIPGIEATDRYAGYRRVLETGEPFYMESFQPGGVFGDKQFSMRAFKVGNNLGLIWTDVTEVKKAAEAVRQSEETMRSVYDSVDSGFIIVDGSYRIRNANRAYCQQAGLSLEAVVGNHCFAVSHKASRPCFEDGEECAVKKAFETGESATASHVHHDADGSILYVETKAFPLKNAAGDVTSVIESVSNITDKHLLEEERLKTQKLEAIGTLAGGIAHDFNNLLQGVFGFISLAKLRSDDRTESIEALEEAEKALHLSVRLTNQLLTFSKGGTPVKRPLELRPVIENGAKFALSGSRSDCRIDIDPALWLTEADEGQISQVIQNIVLNADQAMPEGGRVVISARNLHVQGRDQVPGLAQGRYVEIAIADSGIGIPEQYLGKIFDPYFTTKEKGSGLGLATSYSIVKSHHGSITVRSEAGKGTTFVLYLPASMAEEREVAAMPSAAEASARYGKILVMDDERIIRDVAGALISALGHEVEYAVRGEEAIERYRAAKQSGHQFDAVILDLTVRGGMGGAATLAGLREIDPAVRAIVSSGYSDDAVTSSYRQQGFRAFLKKPYDVEALREALNSVLAG